MEEFYSGCKSGDLEKVKSMVSSNSDETIYSSGTVLAVENGHVEVVEYLKTKGIDILSVCRWIVGLASRNGHLEMVEYLVDLGADPGADDNCAIKWACEHGYLEIVKYLRYRLFEVDLDFLLYRAVENGHLHMVAYLVKNGADPELDDNCLVAVASEKGHLDIVKFLVSVGADVRGQNNQALLHACDYGYLDLLKYLVSQGADFRHPCALIWASSSGHLDVVKYLFEIDSELDQEMMSMGESLEFASKAGHLDVAEFLLKKSDEWDSLTPEHQEYFTAKFAYKKWRRIHLRNWVRKVLRPLYYSPHFQGGIQAKKELETCLETCL